MLKPAVVGHGFSGASIPGFSHRRVSTPHRVVKEPVSILPDPSYYTDLEPEPPVEPRTLAYANLFDDTEDKYYTTQGAFSIASLAASDYPLVLFAFEVSEYLGSKPADAPDSSTDYATAFRVTLTVYKAANKTADVGTPLTVGLWFEEGETRKSVRVGYLDDEDGTEKFLDFTKTSAPEAPFSKSPQSLTVRVDSAGSAVIHVAAVAGSISSPPIAGWFPLTRLSRKIRWRTLSDYISVVQFSRCGPRLTRRFPRLPRRARDVCAAQQNPPPTSLETAANPPCSP